MVKAKYFIWIVLSVFLFSSFTFTKLSAGVTRYYDVKGNEISEEEYRILTGREKKPPKKNSNSPEPTPATEVSSEQTAKEESDEASESMEAEEDEGTGIDLNIVSETILRTFERDVATKGDSLVVPIYEYLTVEYGRSKSEGLSFHFQGWGRVDAADSGYFDNKYQKDPDGSLLNMYFQYARPEDGYALRLGRQQVFKGVSSESIDGLWAETNFTPYFVFSAYGGIPVGLDEVDGRNGDLTWGGRMANRLQGRYEIGVSYKRLDNDSVIAEETAGADFFLALPLNAGLNGYVTYNLQTEDWAEHSYDLQFGISDLYFKLFYERFSYADYFIDDKTSSNIFGFLRDTGEVLTVIGADGYWRQLGNVALGADIRHYSYDIRQDSAMYYAGILKGYIGGSSEIGGEVGLMEGETPETRYLLGRVYFYWDSPFNFMQSGFFTGDAVYVAYDEEIFGKDRSVFCSLGTGFNLYRDMLQLKISGDYSDDPYFDSDIRGTMVLLLTL